MFSLCITTYNRYEMTMESFANVINDARISEIVIVDDCSDIEFYDKLAASTIDMPKVRLFRNTENLGMSLNKKRAIELAKSEWCILFDSDNVIGKDYLDAMPELNNLQHHTIFCPSFAKPKFDYRKYSGKYLSPGSIKYLLKDPVVEMCLNTCNYLVNRSKYLDLFLPNPEIKGTDTLWFNYIWLKAGNTFFIMPGMEYEHRVHNGSGWMQDADYNMKQGKKIKELIKAL